MTAKFSVSFGELRSKKNGKHKAIDRAGLSDFWDEIGTGGRRGVYVFGVRAGKGWKPLYVGQTKRQTFRKRMGQHMPSVGGDFDDMLRGIKKGTPVLFLIGREGKGRNSTTVIDALEIEFINYAFARNKHLHNDRGIRKPAYAIHGLAGRGRRGQAVIGLKEMLGC